MSTDQKQGTVCVRCEGRGWYWRVPDGFNPFLVGAIQTAKVSYKVICPCANMTET